MKRNHLKMSAVAALTGLMCCALNVTTSPIAAYNLTASAASAGQTLSVGNGMSQHKGDNVDGYSYEIWIDQTGGSGSMTLGSGGSFNTEWSAQVSAGNFLARRGRNYDASKKATQYGSIVMDYAADYSASAQGNSRLCVYGWFKDPLVEYYIIEDWVNWCPSGNGSTVTIDGAQYDIFQLDHTGPTILGNTQTFKQYFSVRKQKRTSGTITVSDHFKAWENAGWNIGNLTEVALNVEGWESSGRANVSKLTIGEGGGGSQPAQNNDWNQNNNQNNGWDWNNQNQNNDWNNQNQNNGWDWNNWNQNNDWNNQNQNQNNGWDWNNQNQNNDWNNQNNWNQNNDWNNQNQNQNNGWDWNNQNNWNQNNDWNSWNWNNNDWNNQNNNWNQNNDWNNQNQNNNWDWNNQNNNNNWNQNNDWNNQNNWNQNNDWNNQNQNNNWDWNNQNNNNNWNQNNDWNNQNQNNGWDWNNWNNQNQNNNNNWNQNNDWNSWNWNNNDWNNQNQNNGWDWNNQNNWNQNNDWNNQNNNWNQNNDWNNQNNNNQNNNNGGVDPSKPMIAISFDDGASPQTGNRIVSALSKNGFHATFFYVGDWIRDANGEQEIRNAYAQGMEIANHTTTHPYLTQLGSAQIRSEFDNTHAKLKNIIGAEPSKLMRLPYLDSNGTVTSTLNDVALISCALDTQDWNGHSKDQIVNDIKGWVTSGQGNGAIVLCHETYDSTASAMEEVLPWIKSQGWQVVTISEMFAAKGKQLNGGTVYTRV